MSPDLFRPRALPGSGDRRRATQLAGRKGAPSPNEARNETTPSGADAWPSERAHVRIEQVPRDFVSQVDYDWLVVDTNCWTHLIGIEET